MAAGLGYKEFATGDVLTAADANGYLASQVVMVFASAADRTTAITSPQEGMISFRKDADALEYYSGSAWAAVAGDVTLTGTQTLTNKTMTAPIENNPLIKSPEERCTISATAATGTVAFDTQTQGVLYYTTNASANFTLNFTNVDANLTTGDSISCVFLNTNGATAYYPTAFEVDSSAVTPKWSGGTAPAAGNASAIDAYSFTIIKTADATFTVLAGGAVQFA